MKKTQLFIILAFIAGLCSNVGAEDYQSDAITLAPPPPPVTQAIDPTLAFFAALSSCVPGQYTEKNILISEVGQAVLNQQIIGVSEDSLTCNVILATPDNRSLVCMFPMHSLIQLNDQRFLEGVLERDAETPSKNSINADMLWSELKADNCELVQ